MNIIMERLAYLPHSTIGRFWINDELFYTVEQPWMDNKPFMSCVPDGPYELLPDPSDKSSVPGGVCWALHNPDLNVYQHKADRTDETQRYQCLFVHVGNFPRNFQGCVGAGMKLPEHDTIYDGINKVWVNGVGQSTIAVKRIYELLVPGTKHQLEIINFEGAKL